MMQHFVELGHCMAVQKALTKRPKDKPPSFIFTRSFAYCVQQYFQCYILHAVHGQEEAKIYRKAIEPLGVMPDWILPLADNAVVMDEQNSCEQNTTSLFDYAQTMMLSDQLAYVDILYFSANALAELDEWALQQLFTLCTRIKINGGCICFYYQYQEHFWNDESKMLASVQLLEPLMDSVFYDAGSFAKLTHMDAQACLAYLRNRLIHDIIIKLPNHQLLVADACVEAMVDAAVFYQSTTPESDEMYC